jgi:hypothetical protein
LDIERGGVVDGLFANLSSGNIDRLNIPTYYENGTVLFIQGEWGILQPDDPNVIRIGSFGIDVSKGMLLEDTLSGRAGVAHLDDLCNEIDVLSEMREELINAGARPENLVLHVTSNFNSLLVSICEQYFASLHQDLPGDFVNDVKDKKVVEGMPQISRGMQNFLALRIVTNSLIREKHKIGVQRVI